MANEEVQMTEEEMAAAEQAAAAEEAQGSSESYMMPAPPPPPSFLESTGQHVGAAASGGLARLSEAMEQPAPASRLATTEANGDDLSDLFEGPDANDLDVNIDDLVGVDEEDVFGEGGEDMSDLISVSNEDIMGEDIYAPKAQPAVRRVVRTISSTPPAGMGRLSF
jgi:hypothetical protein